MKTFKLNRLLDSSGYSGTGYIAEGMITSYGEVIMRWYGGGISVFNSYTDMYKVHGHGGKTVVDFITDDGVSIKKETRC